MKNETKRNGSFRISRRGNGMILCMVVILFLTLGHFARQSGRLCELIRLQRTTWEKVKAGDVPGTGSAVRQVTPFVQPESVEEKDPTEPENGYE